MPHETRIVHCLTPNDPHAFDGIPVLHRSGQLDRLCPLCHGHGQPRRFTRLGPSDDRA